LCRYNPFSSTRFRTSTEEATGVSVRFSTYLSTLCSLHHGASNTLLLEIWLRYGELDPTWPGIMMALLQYLLATSFYFCVSQKWVGPRRAFSSTVGHVVATSCILVCMASLWFRQGRFLPVESDVREHPAMLLMCVLWYWVGFGFEWVTGMMYEMVLDILIYWCKDEYEAGIFLDGEERCSRGDRG
ncbi:hypothetical protein GGR53DRAFT_158930, partial [Hypoxylon sp. FL1150]